MSATVQRVARPKGDLSAEDDATLLAAMNEWATAHKAYRATVVQMVERSSFRAVAEVTGLSTNTLQRWKREALTADTVPAAV